jgi:putative ABC transport system ATP-binding protein
VACRPTLVLADEPTASLDPENASRAMDVIQSACREQGAALVCTSHDPAMVARFTRSLALESIATITGQSRPQEAR